MSNFWTLPAPNGSCEKMSSSLSLVTTWEKLLPFWNLAHFVSQSIKSLFVNFYNRHNWITVATRKFFDYIYLSISCQPMLRHIFFTELNRRCFTLDDFALLFLQLHFHRYLSILVWESERSRNMVKMFSVTCLSNSWKNFREELVTLVFVPCRCLSSVCVAPGMSITILGLDAQEGCTWRVLLKHTLHPCHLIWFHLCWR